MISNRTLVISGVVLAIGLAAFASPFASSSPDGLEKVAEEHGIPEADKAAWQHAAIPDYQVPGIAHEGTATGLAGVIGTVCVLVAGLVVGRLIARRSNPAP